MEKIFYPTQKTYNRGILWIQRIASMVFLYATLTLPANISLMNTPLVTTLRGEYPTWWHVMWDMCLTVMILAVLFFVGKLLVLYTRSHPVSRKYIEWIRKIDSKFIQNFLNFDFFLIKFVLALLFSVVLWVVLKPVLSLYVGFHLPLYSEQPVVFVMVILGLIVFVESFQTWKLKMRKHVHLREKL